MKEDARVNTMDKRRGLACIAVVSTTMLLSGCVLNEKYEAEKARSLNFQRLLAQEEKRTAELDNEVKRSKKELTELDTRNRELTAQVQAVREQMGRVQEEAEAMKEAALLERKARADMKRAAVPAPKPPSTESMPSMSELLGTAPSGLSEPAALPEPPAAPAVETAAATKLPGSIHVVKPGETLYRIGKRYGVKLETLRKWNKLPDDIIEVGQKLIVSQE